MIDDKRSANPVFTTRCSTYADLFGAQAAKTPNATALVCGEKKLTYHELDERANRLAGYLISLGVGPDMPVGVCVNRSLNMAVAILGIVKAGGAYLPLDPAYPGDRISFILKDACAGVVVSQNAYLDIFQEHGTKVVAMDRDEQVINSYPAVQPLMVSTIDNLVYVIYTSGSTGKPKGVMITHANLCNFVHIACSVLDVHPDDVYLQSATVAYALSVRQLMVPLLVGATIVVATSEEVGDPLELFKLIKQRDITLMDVVPSFWRSCIQRISDLPKDEQTSLMSNRLRRIVSIGEALQSDLPRDWYDRFGHQTQLVNIFGQTETTGVVAAYPIPHDAQMHAGIVPIGHSASWTQIYLLDPNLQPVPDGEAGELCVSNPCLARGYLNRPELTAEKFIPNPFLDGFSDRLYRTGDLARRRPDGNIEFLGRGDHQVKIRGQRLELGEVEASLREHEAVRDCVVMARGDTPDDKYLAAYVVLSTALRLTSFELKDFVRKRLPEYMIPAVFVFLDALPLNPNGKVNRLALPDPKALEVKEQFLSGEMAEPSNQIEKTIARIWQEALKLDRVGMHDNFFDLGGHSLMAVRVLTHIERAFRVRLPLTSFLHSATIAQLAELVDGREDEAQSWSPVVAIRTKGHKTPFFGIHPVGGGVLVWKDIVKYLPDDQPFYALQAQGVDGMRPALRRIEDMASLYVSEICKIQPHGPYSLGGYSLGGEIAFEMAQQLLKLGETIELLVLFDTRNPFRAIRPVRVEGATVIPVLDARLPEDGFEILKIKAGGHIRRLKQMNRVKGVKYILKLVWFHAKDVIISSIAKLYRLIHKRLPDALLLQYLRTTHAMALRNYVPTLYPGKITIFHALESQRTNPIDSPMGWAPLAKGGLEVHYFDTPHTMIQPEYGEQIARKLNECMLVAENNRKGIVTRNNV